MLLSYTELNKLVEQGVIRGVKEGAVNASSIDVHLGGTILIEEELVTAPPGMPRAVDLMNRESLYMREIELGRNRYLLRAGHFILAHTVETFHLPDDISAQFLLKSTIGRCGMNHLNSTWCDAGWHDSSLTLELKNDTRLHTLKIGAGLAIGQIKFFRHAPVPGHASYRARGRYNNDPSVQGAKT